MTDYLLERLNDIAVEMQSQGMTACAVIVEAAHEIERMGDRISQLEIDLAEAREAHEELSEKTLDVFSALFEARALMIEAQTELKWWIDNHGCCEGHEGDLLTRIDAAREGERPVCARCKSPDHHVSDCDA